LTLINFLTKT